MPPRILALDLGTACGWALCDRAAPPSIAFGTFDLKHGRFAGGGVRFVRFRDALTKFTGQVDEVVFEAVQRHAGTAAAHCYGGLLAVLTTWCEDNAIPYDGRSVQAIKKAATGKGNAKKDEMVSAAKALGYDVQDDNAADAIHLLRMRLKEIDAG
jgi:Holliday junction resolvasome RuvABC endonuclease subunit